MSPFRWRLLTAVAIVWSGYDVFFRSSYAMALSVAAGFCLARGVRAWEREQQES